MATIHPARPYQNAEMSFPPSPDAAHPGHQAVPGPLKGTLAPFFPAAILDRVQIAEVGVIQTPWIIKVERSTPSVVAEASMAIAGGAVKDFKDDGAQVARRGVRRHAAGAGRGKPGVSSAHALTVSQNSPLLQRPQSEVSRDQPASSSTTHPP